MFRLAACACQAKDIQGKAVSRRVTHHHGGVDALSGEGVDVAGSVAHNDEVVVIGLGHALGAQAQRGRAHTLDFGIRPDGLADEGVALQRAVVQPLQVGLLRPHM